MAFFIGDRETFSKVLRKYFTFKNDTRSLDPLYEVLRSIKKEDFDIVLAFLKDSPEISENLSYYLKNVFEQRQINISLTEANILSENAFFPEFRKRLLDKILPPVANDNTVWQLIDYVSARTSKDLAYFRNIPEYELDEFLELLGIAEFSKSEKVKSELLFSLNILAWRIIGDAMEVEVVNMVPEYRKFDNPFLALQKELDVLNQHIKGNPQFVLTKKDEHYKQAKVYLNQCLEFVNLAFKNASKYGISGKINLSLLKIRQQLHRMRDILSVMAIGNEETPVMKSKQLLFNILEYKSHKNNLKELFADSTTLLSHLITNHTAETGSHYITSTKKDYMKMLMKASGGGIIVGALCNLKMFYGSVPGSDFSHAFQYSLNYVMGFVMIYLMGFALATKQPSMTATTMAKVLSEGKNNDKNYIEFAHLVSKLFRSQFIAFVGNVMMSFPVAMIIIYGLDVLMGYNFATEKSTKMIENLNFFKSTAILQGCLTGVYLFISGIVSGNVANQGVYYKIPRRIAQNSNIRSLFGEKFALRLSKFYSRNWAGIMSYVCLGLLMGTTASIGSFLGLNIDTKHISFEAGNLALALYGSAFSLDVSTILIAMITIVFIGFSNFAVSFGLSMFLAFRSRKIHFGEVRQINAHIIRYFFRNPLIFFFPIRSYLDEKAKKLIESTTKSEGH